MSLGTSLLKPDGVSKRKHKLVDDYPSACGVSPKRITLASDCDNGDQLRVALTPSLAAPRHSVRVCALTLGFWDVSSVIAQSGADILLHRKKPDGATNWRIDSSYDISVLEIDEATRIAFRASRLQVGRQMRFDRMFDLLARQANDALLGGAFFRSATFAYLRSLASSRAAIVELRDLLSDAQIIICFLDAGSSNSAAPVVPLEKLPIFVVETCALLNEAQKIATGGNSTLLLFASDEVESLDAVSCWPIFDEIVTFGYPNSDTITLLQRIRMRSTEASHSNAESAPSSALIDLLWHFFQHSVVGLRRAARSTGAAAQRRFQLWFATPNAVRIDADSSECAVIDLNASLS